MTEGPVETAPVGEETAPVETQPVDIQQQNSGETGGGDNPAWKSVLDLVPESLHSQIKPGLKEWDRGVSQKFEEIHQQYAPYKSLMDKGITADIVEQSYALLQALDSDPRSFYDQMGAHYGYVGSGQETPTQTPVQQPTTEGEQEFDFGSPELNDAWAGMQRQFAEQQKVVEMMAQLLVGQNQEAQQAQEDAQLDEWLSGAHEKHGDFDEGYVLSLIANGMDPDKAIDQYNSIVNSAVEAKQRPPAPQVLGGTGNGSLPVEKTDVTKLTAAQTRQFVADRLREAASNSQ